MLSDYERREWELIEQGLESDPRLVASFRAGPGRRRWPIRLLLVLGVLLVVTGVLSSTGVLVAQGLLALGVGIAWSRWRTWWTARTRQAPT